MTITVDKIDITPEIALQFLSFNADNRPLRRTVVENFKGALLRGEYVMTHQGVAFSEAGILMDGQHRLTAISELRDGSFPMLVTRGLPDDAFKSMDGGVKRTASDALKEDKRLVEAARLIAVLCSRSESKSSPTVPMLIPYIEEIALNHAELMDAYSSAVKTWTSAPVRVAAIVALREGADIDYVKSIYRLLATRDLDAMPPVARALFKSESSGVVRASNTTDMIARCLVVFDRRRAQNKIIKVNGTASTYALIRESFKEIVEQQATVVLGIKGEKKAAPLSAAKGISRAHYLTAAR